LGKEILDRLEAQGEKLERTEMLRDLEALQHIEVESEGKRFLLCTDLAETTAELFRPACKTYWEQTVLGVRYRGRMVPSRNCVAATFCEHTTYGNLLSKTGESPSHLLHGFYAHICG